MKNRLFGGLMRLALVAAPLLLAVRASAVVPWTILINTNNIVNVTSFGAVGDGVTTNTLAISNAIVAASAGGTTNGLSGGTVEIPPGVYMCGPFPMKSCVNLQVDAGAILRMLPLSAYPGGTTTGTTFISGSNLHDIEISGPGAIDGQGAAWWAFPSSPRAVMISPNDCNRVLIQNITLSNSPMFHIAISGGSSANTTVQGVTIYAPADSPNTDACDVDGTNILVQNNNISEGDDDFTCGGGTCDVLVTNNTYGTGHGISIGSYTDDGGVSNITVINCTISGAVNGIRIKSDNNRGGLVQNIHYMNIGITNVDFPIQIYAYYNWYGTPDDITPAVAASTNAVSPPTSTTPIYRDITFSNITATSVGGYPAAIIWARTEMPATNIVFDRVNVSAARPFEVYNASGVQLIDSQVSGNTTNLWVYNAQVTISNSVPTNELYTIDGLTTNGYRSDFAVYGARATLKNTNCFYFGPLTVGAGAFIVSNNLTLYPTTAVNYVLGTNAAQLDVVGNLALGGTNNISAGAGFTNGTYTLMTYTGGLSGSPPVLGAEPAGYNCSLSTSTAGQVNLVVTQPAPPAPANLVAAATNLQINLQWDSVAGAATYNLKRGTTTGGPYPTVVSGLTTTNDADTNVTNAVDYYYVVTAVDGGGESGNSPQASAAPLPSNQPTNLAAHVVGGQLELAWPQNHQGWRLQIQTNSLGAGLGTNWATVPGSTNMDSFNLGFSPTNPSVFLRLIYP